VPELGREADTASAPSLQDSLRKKLEAIFENISHSVRYGYSLNIPLDRLKQDGQSHLLKVNIKVPGEQATLTDFTVNYPLSWGRGASVPVAGPPEVTRKIQFLETPIIATTHVQLWSIYLSVVSFLVVLAFIPLIMERVQAAGREREGLRVLKSSVVVLKKGSNLIGLDCPNHRMFPKPFVEGDVIVVCPNPNCNLPHHLDCWKYNKCKCMKFLCPGELPIPDDVLIKHGVSVS